MSTGNGMPFRVKSVQRIKIHAITDLYIFVPLVIETIDIIAIDKVLNPHQKQMIFAEILSPSYYIHVTLGVNYPLLAIVVD